MLKKTAFIALIFFLAIALAACSALPGASTATTAAASAATTTDSALESKLAIGILKLENSELAVSADQAGILLTLWQGVRLLTSDKSASPLELTALYQQIQENLTPDQLQAIQQVSWTQEEIAAMIQASGATAVSQTNTTRKTNSSTPSQTGGPADFGGPGGPGGNSDLALVNGMSIPSTSTQTTPTPIVASNTTAKTALSTGLNAQLANAVIDLLQKRSAV